MLYTQIIFLCLLALGRSAVIQEDNKGGSEDDGVKAALKAIEERLDRWDNFYMGRLEPRMIGAATSLANLDTNIRNLQERAHVWDTFQLHVAAWNDQIKSLHSKINIINESVEKALSPDSRLVSTLNSLDDKFKTLENNQVQPRDSFTSDFALKKLVHLVQKIERKLDKIGSQNQAEIFDERSGCNSGFDNLLREVSNKVDAVFGEDEQPSRACRRLSEDLRKAVQEGPQQLRHASYRNRDLGNMLRDVEQGYKKLLKHQEKNFEESEDILRDIEKRLGDIEDDDDLEELIVKKFKQVERQLRGIRAEIDEDDDSDEDKKSRRHRDDTDEDDDSDDDDDDSKERRHRKKDDDDSDDDDDDTRERRNKKKDDDDDDSDDDDTRERKNKKKDDDDSDDDDDDTRERRTKKKDDDDSDDDDDDTRERRTKKKDDDDSDDDDDDTRERRTKKKDDDDSDDDDDDDSREKRSKKKRDTHEDDDDISKQKLDNETDVGDNKEKLRV